MPVIIRNNNATELCITKGQEDHIVGWQAGKGPHGKNILDTLFIKLDQPAKTVNIDGLPENCGFPITRGSKNVECIFSSDLKEYIHRSQVWVLPNFSMTDYTSQGKTRPKNPVDLSKLAEATSPIIPAFQGVQLQVEWLLCSHFYPSLLLVELQGI